MTPADTTTKALDQHAAIREPFVEHGFWQRVFERITNRRSCYAIFDGGFPFLKRRTSQPNVTDFIYRNRSRYVEEGSRPLEAAAGSLDYMR